MRRSRSGLWKAARYLAVVGSAAVIDLGGFLALHSLGVAVVVAAAASFLTAAVFNYVASARWVFAQRPSAATFAKFLVLGMIGLLVNTTVTWGASQHLVPILAKALGIGVAFAFNAVMNVVFVFGRGTAFRPSAAPADDGA